MLALCTTINLLLFLVLLNSVTVMANVRHLISFCGEGGIRTLEGAIKPPTPLAGERLRPLSHLSNTP